MRTRSFSFYDSAKFYFSIIVIGILVNFLYKNCIYGNIILVVGSLAIVFGTIKYVLDVATPPDFKTKHGTAIWCSDIEEIDKDIMDRAIEHFVEIFSKHGKEYATREEVEKMLEKIDIEWSRVPVSWNSFLNYHSNQHGLQCGNKIKLLWTGNVYGTALNHELLHAINELIRLPKMSSEERGNFIKEDLDHMEKLFWDLEIISSPDF